MVGHLIGDVQVGPGLAPLCPVVRAFRAPGAALGNTAPSFRGAAATACSLAYCSVYFRVQDS